MGAGYHGGFGKTKGSNAAPGSTYYMDSSDAFSKFIKNRKDVDANGFYDIIAHGTQKTIQIQHNGVAKEIDHRIAAKLFLHDKNYHGGGIRLFSCSTGELDSGFAQNLANKLKIPVQAPTDYIWAKQNGHYYVTGGILVNGRLVEDFSKKGYMKTFYPQGRRTNE